MFSFGVTNRLGPWPDPTGHSYRYSLLTTEDLTLPCPRSLRWLGKQSAGSATFYNTDPCVSSFERFVIQQNNEREKISVLSEERFCLSWFEYFKYNNMSRETSFITNLISLLCLERIFLKDCFLDSTQASAFYQLQRCYLSAVLRCVFKCDFQCHCDSKIMFTLTVVTIKLLEQKMTEKAWYCKTKSLNDLCSSKIARVNMHNKFWNRTCKRTSIMQNQRENLRQKDSKNGDHSSFVGGVVFQEEQTHFNLNIIFHVKTKDLPKNVSL